MLSVHSRTRTKCCPYLYWKQYSEALDRKSRNCASLFLSVFFVLLLFCMAFFTDRTVSLPAGRQKTVLVFRAVQESVYQKTPADMKKLLAETSAVSVPLEADISKRSESVREMPKAAESEKKFRKKHRCRLKKWSRQSRKPFLQKVLYSPKKLTERQKKNLAYKVLRRKICPMHWAAAFPTGQNTVKSLRFLCST